MSEVRIIDMNEDHLRAIVREESDAYNKVFQVLNDLPPVGTGIAAKALHVTTKTINEWRKKGKIQSVNGKIPLTEIFRLKTNPAA